MVKMTRHSFCLCGLIIILLIPVAIHAQQWSGIIDPSRAVDWSNAGIPGGIPNRINICATLNPGATSSQINSAIASCPPNQVVYLNSGTYNITSGITFAGHNNVTLRGAGADQTILVFTGGDNCGGLGGDVCVINSTGYYVGTPAVLPGGSNAANWTAGYTKGTTQITLDNVSGLSVGSIIVLDQANDAADPGGVIICDTLAVCRPSTEAAAPGRVIGGMERNQQQFVQVKAINGNTVTISPGLYASNWSSAKSPGAWWTGPQITLAGIENMTLDHTASTSATSGIYFFNAHNCWVTGVKDLNSNRNHVWLYQSSGIQVQSNYLYGVQGGGSQSYGVEAFMTSDDLIVNNIFQHITASLMVGPSAGLVAAYNYETDSYYTTTSWLSPSISFHDAGAMLDLFEGNQFANFNADLYHGTTELATFFRNQLTGYQSGKTNNTEVIDLWAYSRYMNFVGNVLGTPGYHRIYEDSSVGLTGSPNTSIYLLGYSGVNESLTSGISFDTKVGSTLLRWGNYDVVTGLARWNSSEIPAGNSVPSSQTLPASFFLASKPGWWGSVPWPPIGPDVLGGNDPTGHVYNVPATICFANTTKDSNGILIFNAGKCYQQSLPAAPTNLTSVVH
jgi:hypothetical protein